MKCGNAIQNPTVLLKLIFLIVRQQMFVQENQNLNSKRNGNGKDLNF